MWVRERGYSGAEEDLGWGEETRSDRNGVSAGGGGWGKLELHPCPPPKIPEIGTTGLDILKGSLVQLLVTDQGPDPQRYLGT